MGAEGDIQVPVVPGRKFGGALCGEPKTPRVPPVKAGPALLRSIVPLPAHPESVVAAAQVVLSEFTWMLLEGPPTTVTVEAPLTWNGCGHVGSSTMMGTGCEATIIPQRERASTSWVPLRVISCEKYIFTRSVMSTCMNA